MEMETKSSSTMDTKKVIVHVTFLKVGEINTLKEQFDAEVLIRTKWREPRLDGYEAKPGHDIDWKDYWSPEITIDNSFGDPKVTFARCLDFNESKQAWVRERRRVKGTFIETFELWEFPFDIQDLSLDVMSDLPAEEVELIEDPNEMHKMQNQSFIDEQEWCLYKYIESEIHEITKDKADPTSKRSTLKVKCKAARRCMYFVWNIFSVTFLIGCLSFLSFCLPNTLAANRLQLSFTLMLTSVAFKFVANQSLPRISYLTYLDRYILTTVIALVSICFWHGLQALFDASKEVDRIASYVFIALFLIYNIQFCCSTMAIPWRRRQDLKRSEHQYNCEIENQKNKSTRFNGAPSAIICSKP